MGREATVRGAVSGVVPSSAHSVAAMYQGAGRCVRQRAIKCRQWVSINQSVKKA